MLVGTQLNKEGLYKRRQYIYSNRVSLKSNMAYIMLRHAKMSPVRPPTSAAPTVRVLDMFCGSGTILLEAADWFGPGGGLLEAVGLDVSQGAVDGAAENAAAEGPEVAGLCTFMKCDAKAIRSRKGQSPELQEVLRDESFDAICSNVSPLNACSQPGWSNPFQ